MLYDSRAILEASLYFSAIILIILDWVQPESWLTGSSEGCDIVMLLLVIANCAIMTSATIFAAVRVYAIFDRSKMLFLVTSLVGLVNPVLTGYTMLGLESQTQKSVASQAFCGSSPSVKSASWITGARGSSLAADGLLLALTWIKTRNSAQNGRAEGVRPHLSQTLLQDSIATGHLSDFWMVTALWTPALTSILMSRLLLDLREASDMDVNNDNDEYISLSKTCSEVMFVTHEDWRNALLFEAQRGLTPLYPCRSHVDTPRIECPYI
ncbi:predicted protein [Postia placenta Mad-698-R]|nr:predicted protein [Postia placenta Mad-698-R]